MAETKSELKSSKDSYTAIRQERKARQSAFESMEVGISIGILFAVVIFFVSVAVIEPSYNSYIDSLKASQGFWSSIFSLVEIPTMREYVIQQHPVGGFFLYILLPLLFIGWLALCILGLMPPQKSRALIQWEKKIATSQAHSSKLKWLVEVYLALDFDKGEKEELEENELRHRATLELAQVLSQKGVKLELDPFVHSGRSSYSTAQHICDSDYVRNLLYWSPGICRTALLLYYIEASDYGKAVIKADEIVQDLIDELSWVTLDEMKIRRYEKGSGKDTSGSSSIHDFLDEAVSGLFRVALFAGTAFVAYKAVKAGTVAVRSASDATMGRAGRLVDAATRRLENK